MMQHFYFLGLVWFKPRYLMWYFKNKTQQQLVFCEYIYFFYYLLFPFFGYHFNIWMEQKYPKLLYWDTAITVLSSFWCPPPHFFFSFFISNERNAIILWIPQDFFSFGKNYKTFKNLKQIKHKKSVCVVYFMSCKQTELSLLPLKQEVVKSSCLWPCWAIP